ncbi:MAG: ISAs1 family transposase [Rectinemataceae bacterium]
MGTYTEQDLRYHISKLEDPRIERNKRHTLLDIIMIVLSAIICKIDGWEEIEEWAILHEEWLSSFLELANGIPSHDTVRRVFQRLNPKTIQACLTEWVTALRVKASGEIIAIDGKTVRGAGVTETGTPVLHSVSAWASDVRLTLAQLKTEEKSNEITAIPALLDLIDIAGCSVTIDAMGCQTKIAERIVKGKAGYVRALKGNQPNLLENIAGFFETELERNFRDAPHQYKRTVDKDHGRLEIREYWHTDNVSWMSERDAWKGLASVGMVKRTRTIKEKTSTETQYFISTLSLDVERFAQAVRSQWGIENSLHWVLDVTMGEDACRVRKDLSVENLAVLRRTALNLFRTEGTLPDKSMPKKMLRAASDHAFFAHVLLGQPYTPPARLTPVTRPPRSL